MEITSKAGNVSRKRALNMIWICIKRRRKNKMAQYNISYDRIIKHQILPKNYKER